MARESALSFPAPSPLMVPEPSPIRVLLADAHPLLRLGVRVLLAEANDLDLVAEADTDEETNLLIDQHNPDVLVLGVNLEGRGGLNVAGRLLDRTPTIHLVGLGDLDQPKVVYELLGLRAAAFVSKRDAPLHLLTAIRATAAGAVGYFSPTVARWLAEQQDGVHAQPSDLGLTRREIEVLRLVAQGHRNDQIAQTLFISPTTVRNHLAHVFDKLGVNRRAEAVAWAWRNGILQD